jgi:hypothetical protein
MGGRRGGHPASDTADTVIPFAASATNSASHGKILRLGAFAALFAVVAVPTLFEADVPSVAANSTLKCLDSFGNYEPCVTQASAPPSRPAGRTTEVHQPASLTATTPYQSASWTATAPSQQASWATTAVDQPANPTTDAPAAAQRSNTPVKRPASARCRRSSIPCFFSALRKRIAHIASAVAVAGQPKPGARERL